MLTDYLKKLIDRQAEKDSDFKSLLSKPNKSLKELAEYVTGEAFKAVKDAPTDEARGRRTCYWDDETMLNHIIHYYQEDDVKPEPLPENVSTERPQPNVQPKDEPKPVKTVKLKRKVTIKKKTKTPEYQELSLF